MSSTAAEATFVETKEHLRFEEFCDAIRRYRYIGLCYGPAGVGKTLSARHYACWDEVPPAAKWADNRDGREEHLERDVVFYTVPVNNTAVQIANDIQRIRHRFRTILLNDLATQQDELLRRERSRLQEERRQYLAKGDWPFRAFQPTVDPGEVTYKIINAHRAKRLATKDPTTLIVVDEADRLRMTGLEQMREIFDEGGIGLVLIGMPGLEKRLSRYAQLYSRVGFVHEFRPLAHAEIRRLLQEKWRPHGVSLPDESLTDEEGIATIIRVTNGNFRLLDRLLTQISRVLQINMFDKVSSEVVEAARESLVIGTA